MESYYMIDVNSAMSMLDNSMEGDDASQLTTNRFITVHERGSPNDDVNQTMDSEHGEEGTDIETHLEPVKSGKILASRWNQRPSLYVRARYPQHLHHTKYVNNNELLRKRRFNLPPSLRPKNRYNGQAVLQSCKPVPPYVSGARGEKNNNHIFPSFPVRRKRTVAVQCQSLRAPNHSVEVQCQPEQSDFAQGFYPATHSRGTMKTTVVKMKHTQVPVKAFRDAGHNATVTTRPCGIQAAPATEIIRGFPVINVAETEEPKVINPSQCKRETIMELVKKNRSAIDYEDIRRNCNETVEKFDTKSVDVDTNTPTILPETQASDKQRQNQDAKTSTHTEVKHVDEIARRCAGMSLNDTYSSDFDSADEEVEKIVPYGLRASCEL